MPLIKPRYFAVLSLICLVNVCTASKHFSLLPDADGTAMMSFTPVDTNLLGKDSIHTDAFMEELLKQHPQYFDSILKNRNAYNVQVIYTKVDRGANGIPSLRQYYFNVAEAKYFYPAAAVDLPIAMLTLQKMAALKEKGVDKNTTMLTEAAFSKQTAVYNDPATADGKPTIHQYIKRMLIGDDADAANRLYELLGQEYINDQLLLKGYPEARVLQRQDKIFTEEQNRHTNPIRFVGPSNQLIWQQPMQYNSKPYPKTTDSLGKAYYENDQLVNHPMSFPANNRISLPDLHNMLISLIFPSKVTASQRFTVTAEDRKYLLQYMSQLPAETIYPPYGDDTVNYYPAVNKYLLYGAERGALPASIRIVNKTGMGYGQLIDVAYIADLDKKIEFFLSAVIYCNRDGILNDEQFDYESLGLPFMKHLGEAIYEYETKREKKIQPDLSELNLNYDRNN